MHQSQHRTTTAASGPATPGIDTFLILAADQLRAALNEATASLGDLTGHVLTLAGHAGAAPEVDRAAQDALVGLQAVDRLQQRLGNVDRNLRALAALLQAAGLQPADGEWQNFLGEVRSRYSTETERSEFDALAAGNPRHER